MKFIHTADWHMGKMLGGFSLLEDQVYFLDGLLALLKEERPDALVVAGDIYDRPIPSKEAVGVLNRFLSKTVGELTIPVLMTAGNHDSGERLSFGSELLALSGLHIAGKLSPSPYQAAFRDEWGEVHFYLLPFVDPPAANSLFRNPPAKTFQQAFDKVAASILKNADFKKRNVLVCHGAFCCTKKDGTLAAEVQIGGADLIDLRGYRDFDYIAAGHLHKRQNIGPQMRYSGSILKYAPTEHRLTPSVSLVTLQQKGSLLVEERTIPALRDLKIVKGRFDALMNREGTDPDYLFVVLEDQELILNAAARLREKYPYLMGLSYQNKGGETLPSPTARETKEKSLMELFQEFYYCLNGEEIPQNQLLAAKEAAAPFPPLTE